MLKKTITYMDYNDPPQSHTEDFYFNMSKAEIIELQHSMAGGADVVLKNMVAAQDSVELISFFKKFICLSYGKKSADGTFFQKSPELTERFIQSEAYSELLTDLIGTPGSAAEFVNRIFPEKLMLEINKQMTEKTNTEIAKI